MSDDLAKRLRNHIAVVIDNKGHVFESETLCDEAADRIEELDAKLAKAVEALTPSGETKAAYIAEVETDCPSGRAHTVSWTATKDIMKMTRHRAELTGGKDE